MRLLLPFLLLACGGDDDGTDGTDDAPTADAPADTDTDADTDADTDTDTDTDTDADTDTDTGFVVIGTAHTGVVTPTAHTGLTDSAPTGDTGPIASTADTGVPHPLTGRTYVFDVNSVNVIQPAAAGGLLTSTLPQPVMMQVIGGTATTLDLRVGLATDHNAGSPQDLCVPTFDLLGADFTADPAFSVGPVTTTVSGLGMSFSIENLEVTGTFDATYDRVFDATLRGVADTAPLAPLVGGGGANAVCSLLGALGINCVPCTASNYCLPYASDSSDAVSTTPELVPRTTADIAADPSCP